MGREIGIVDLLQVCGLPKESRSKLVRHQDKRWDPHDLLRRGWLDAYQAFQSRPVFDDLDYIITCIGVGRKQASFVGVYRVHGRRPGSEGDLPLGCPYVEWKDSAHFYELERVGGFESLEQRVIIEWGEGTKQWHQFTKNKPVSQILPPGHQLKVFTDYFDFTLTHQELHYLFAHQEANQEWRARLSAVAGVYLILATTTGHQYVGSASGTGGIWGRWAAYAADGHGGNKLLRDLVTSYEGYPDAFTYSVLQILPKTTAP
ncbi:MAG TPA: GIY-YIG nuclease family protein, partial [Pyrinomonadaceae bacterium]|nr:GIY-YIG nuclease family protein [Pyrinomonadaceae bacterium]